MEAAFEKETEFIKSVVPTWKDLQTGEISFRVMSGGTRELYKVTALKKGIQPEIVLLRKFRPTSIPERNELEAHLFDALSSHGLSPRCYGYNDKWRVEEFLEGRTLTTKELTDKVLRRKLAMQLGKLHSLTIDKLEKKSLVLYAVEILTPIFNKKYESRDFGEINMGFIEEVKYLFSQEETDFIMSICSNEKDLVICHNDLWSTNILFNEKTSEFTFLDLEGISYNFAGDDLGKILLEPVFYRDRPGCTYELREENFPSEEEIIDFIRYYLVSRNKEITDKAHADSVALDPPLLEEIEKKLFPKKEDHEAVIKKMERQILPGIVVSSYFLVIAIVTLIPEKPTKDSTENPKKDGTNYSTTFSTESMDYFQYAKDAYKFYKKFKSKLEKPLDVE